VGVLRQRQGIARRQRGGRDGHQLVALLRTTQTVIADMISVVLLNLERTGFAAAGARVPDGLVYSEADEASERRLGRSAMYFFFPGVSLEVMKKANDCNSRFRCQALFEGLGARLTSLADDADAVSGMVDSVGCNPELAHTIRNSKPRSPAAWLEAAGPPGVLERSLHPTGR
jgi:hypothetical protein